MTINADIANLVVPILRKMAEPHLSMGQREELFGMAMGIMNTLYTRVYLKKVSPLSRFQDGYHQGLNSAEVLMRYHAIQPQNLES